MFTSYNRKIILDKTKLSIFHNRVEWEYWQKPISDKMSILVTTQLTRLYNKMSVLKKNCIYFILCNKMNLLAKTHCCLYYIRKKQLSILCNGTSISTKNILSILYNKMDIYKEKPSCLYYVIE